MRIDSKQIDTTTNIHQRLTPIEYDNCLTYSLLLYLTQTEKRREEKREEIIDAEKQEEEEEEGEDDEVEGEEGDEEEKGKGVSNIVLTLDERHRHCVFPC
jgi:hypothetical protein